MNLKEIDELTLSRYMNTSHGLELEPDINLGQRGNENGIVYLNSYLNMKDMITPLNAPANVDNRWLEYVIDFSSIRLNCTAVDKNGNSVNGLFNRGKGESYFPKEEIRAISNDNISGFSSISRLLGLRASKDIYSYGKRHLGAFNNTGRMFDYLPMNPGNYSLWAYNGGSKLLYWLFLPFLIINILISTNKPELDTSSKILIFNELYPIRKEGVWKYLWKFYILRMEKMYGKMWVNRLMRIYYLPTHPNVLISDLIKEVK